MTTTAEDIQIGDKVLPPERELRVWMRRHIQEKNLPECALHLTVRNVYHSSDKRGPWIHFKAQYPPEWTATYANPNANAYMTFKARPQTPWTIVREVSVFDHEEIQDAQRNAKLDAQWEREEST